MRVINLNQIFKVYKFPFLILSLVIAISCSDNKIPTVKNKTNGVQTEYDRFGFIQDSFEVIKGEVKKNETLADILIPNDISYSLVSKIYNKSKPKFDFKKILPKHKYRFYYNLDSIQSLNSFVYEINKIKYLVVNLNDTIKINLVEREINIDTNSVSGVINESLYQTFYDNNLSPLLAGKLAEVFAWQIDFYTIQKGDKFVAIYEREKIGNDIVGIGDILAAKFIEHNNVHQAFLYSQDGKLEYFDENGKSLQKQFLKAPLKYKRISSRFSWHRFHPIYRIFRPHLGIDYAANVGTPVQAIGDGTVIEARYNGGAGKFVKVRHNSVYSSGYMHLSRYGKGIKRGAKVKQGQVIGYVGRTGTATGPHLDFRFWKNGSLVNYLTQTFPSTKSIDQGELNDFYKTRDSLKLILDHIEMPDSTIIAEHEQGNNL